MAYIKINQDKVSNPQELIDECPFEALEYVNNYLNITAACKMCKMCVKNHPEIFEFVDEDLIKINKDEWTGIAVYVEHNNGDIHPITYELIGKAKELARKISHPVYCLFMGSDIKTSASSLSRFGIDKVYVYDYKELDNYKIEPYAAVFEDFINKVKPSTVLVGGTTIGRSLAPRVAARFRTGLTADCTILDMQDNTDLDQIRPAFGGNIMAHIRTPKHRPQFATVRYKIFDAPEICQDIDDSVVEICSIEKQKLTSKIQVLEVKPKEPVKGIEDADILVVAGRGVKKEEDLSIIKDFVEQIGGHLASTRPLVEAGWVDPRLQIGLSGRTVKPKLIITCGVSGSIQFRAGMSGSEVIIAINTDSEAKIFDIAHYGIIGDIYKILPKLTEKIKSYKKEECNQ